MRSKILLNVVIISSLIAFIGCSKSESDKNAVLQVMLTDAPAEYDAVWIDIEDVQINTSDNESEEVWISMDVNEGIYNLLEFRNGMDTLLASIELPPGQVSQMRMILGEDNQLTVDNNTYSLETPSGQQSGLKFNIHAELVGGITYKLWIDFDAARSIVVKGNGRYSLKPVIRTFTEALSGAIKGIVVPAEASPYIRATFDGDTLSTYAGDNGYFMLKGASEGSWTVEFFPVDPFISLGVNGVIVERGVVTDMETIYINKPGN